MVYETRLPGAGDDAEGVAISCRCGHAALQGVELARLRHQQPLHLLRLILQHLLGHIRIDGFISAHVSMQSCSSSILYCGSHHCMQHASMACMVAD